ncbi:MAG: hypothetical protein IIC81_10910, partial [Chloroflexi bacterium]|nr:hypothetical protein [Chloroflexota bacterium]
MAEDQGSKEEKFDFDSTGEAMDYIGLDQAQVRAMQIATETPGDYGPANAGVRMAFDVVNSRETDDHYIITLSYRPQGEFAGRPGEEQFFIEKEGTVAYRQVMGLPRAKPRVPVVPVAIGIALVGVIAVGAFFLFGGGGDPVPIVVLPTNTPANTPVQPAVAPAEGSGAAAAPPAVPSTATETPVLTATPVPTTPPTAPPTPTLTPPPLTAT